MNPDQLPLRDLHLPEDVGWWPPAPGWWLLAALLVAALLRYLWALYRQWQHSAARRAALAECQALANRYRKDGNVRALASGLSALTRRAMLAYAPRDSVAGLTGESWLAWLDRGLKHAPFRRGAGRALALLPYQGDADAGDVDAEGLLSAVRERLRTPLPGAQR